MLLLVGLGNPGSNYTNTRHNIGFKIIDAINSHFKLSKQKPKFKGLLTTGNIDEQKILMAVHPDKDVDGFHPTNVGRMALDLPTFLSATPYGIMELLERYKVPTSGKHVVVIGRSHIVGRPMSILMSQKRKAGNATVTIAHSRTENLASITKQADIVIAALGIPEFLTAEMLKDNAVIIDVGITRVPDNTKKKGYRIAGDVDFESVSKKASHITPVPGGVGPMTIAMLLKNTFLAYKKAL